MPLADSGAAALAPPGAREAGFEAHPVDRSQQVDAARWLSELDHRVRREVARAEPERTEAEVAPRGQEAGEVLRTRPDPEVDVAGVARVPVRRQRMAADDEGVNAPCVEQLGKLFEVAVQHSLFPAA